MTFGDDVISFSTIAVLSAHARVYGRQVSPKRSAHHSNFTGGIEARGMLVIAPPYPLSLDIFCNAARLRDGETLGLKAFDMKANGLANLVLHGRDRVTRRDTAWKVWDIRGIVAIRFLDDNGVAH